jgi:signal transduction histidine kinase
MTLSPAARRALIPYVILLAALILTAGAARYAAYSVEKEDSLQFTGAADRVRAGIDNRIDSYIAMLHGAAGLFAASTQVQFPEFRAYVERLEILKRYPGVQGIGFSRFVRPNERASLETAIRAYIPSFHYWGARQAPELHAIVFLEPLDQKNLHAIGFNMFSESTRREAMMRARDEGGPAATRLVRLVQEDLSDRDAQAGFLIYEPVYRSGRIPSSVQARRADLFGFVYIPFRGDDLFNNILSSDDTAKIEFAVYDGTEVPRNLLHASGPMDRPAAFTTNRTIDVAGRPWMLVFRSTPAFTEGSKTAFVSLTAVTGVTLSVLLFVVTRAQIRARESAEQTTAGLRQSEEALRAANQSKDEFLAIVSHELRTPLNAVVGWAAHALEVIERNALAQARLVEDLLDISRAVAGRLRLERSDVDVRSILTAALDAVRPAATAGHIDLGFESAGDLGTIRADPARFQQIVQNLLANAIKFTKPGGRVRLEAVRTQPELTVRVRDTGIGISPAFLPFVFDPFRQADTSTTRAHSGVGLGLAIARHLVELHGGIIQASSDGEGKGTTFTVRLRLRAA